MKNTAPKYSVCIPAYNRPDTIRQAIQSIVGQTVTNWELIVTDDSSDDRVATVVASFEDRRILYVKNKQRLGLENNWNAGLTRARGEYVKMLMDDDYLHPTCLADQGQMLDRHPNVVLVCANYRVVDLHDHPITVPNLGKDPYRLFRGDHVESGSHFIVGYLTGRRRVGLPSAMLIRRSALERSGLVVTNAGVAADADLWLRLCVEGDFSYCDRQLLTMRWHESNLSKILESGSYGYKSILSLYRRWLRSDLVAISKSRGAIALAAAARVLPYYRLATEPERRSIAVDLTSLPLTTLGKLRLRWWISRQ